MTKLEISNPSPPESEDEQDKKCQTNLDSGAINKDTEVNIKKVKNEEPVEWLYGQKFLRDEPIGAMERDFFCDTCKSMMNSEGTWIKHVMGKRHIKRYAALNHVPVDRKTLKGKKRNVHSLRLVGGPSMVRTKTLDAQSLIQNTIDKTHTPLIGLNFIIEVRLMERGTEPIYHCTLCPADCQMTTIINHAGGYRHRMSYLKLCQPSKHDTISSSSQKKSILSERVEKIASKIEKEDGRGRMIIELQVSSENENVIDETTDIERCVPQLPKSTLDACIKQERKLPTYKKLKMLSTWVKEFVQHMNMEENEMVELEDFMDFAKKKYRDGMWNNLVAEKKERAINLLKQCRYAEFMKEVFKMTPGLHGSILKSSVQQVVNERNRGTCSIKKEK